MYQKPHQISRNQVHIVPDTLHNIQYQPHISKCQGLKFFPHFAISVVHYFAKYEIKIFDNNMNEKKNIIFVCIPKSRVYAEILIYYLKIFSKFPDKSYFLALLNYFPYF